MAYGLTPEGFIVKRLADVKLEIETDIKNVLGVNINLLPSGALGQLVGIFSEREALLWEILEDVYNSQYPLTSSGRVLDNVVSLTGITRQPGVKSKVDLTLIGNEGAVIPAGSTFSIPGDTLTKFVLSSEVTIGVSGQVIVTVEADTIGPISAPAGSLTVIDNPIAGLTSVVNALDAILGRDIESDADLKIRREDSLQRAGAGTLGAVVSIVADIDGVTASVGFENNTMITQGDLPPKSFEIVALGGDPADIAKAIWDNKPAGIEVYGDLTQTIIDSQGFERVVKYSRPEDVLIFLELDLSTDSNFPVNGVDQVKAAILNFGNALGIGADVIVYPKLISALNDINGILDVEIRIGTAINPTLANNIPVNAGQISRWDSSRIEVTIL